MALLLPGCIRVSSEATAVLPTTIPTAVRAHSIHAHSHQRSTASRSGNDHTTANDYPLANTSSGRSHSFADATASLTRLTLPPSSPTPASGYTTRIIGYSVEERPLTDIQFGSGPTHIVFVGGIHGGYEWNTILLAYDMIDYFTANPGDIPADVTLHIIPAANPDGQYLVTAQEGRFSPLDVAADSLPGRVNGHGVDLNRNWDCNWTANALWRDQPTSGGAKAFSEPETMALRDFLLELNPVAVIFWHSAANGVFAAGCTDVYQPSLNLAGIYGRAAGYPVYETFTSYQVTGDAGDWLSLQGIPAISVELLNHESTDWSKNRAGVTAVLRQFNQINP